MSFRPRTPGFTDSRGRHWRFPTVEFRTRPGQCRARSLGGACDERVIATARDRADRQPQQPESVSWGGLRGGRRQECTPRDGGGVHGQTGRGLVAQDAFAPGRVPIVGTFVPETEPAPYGRRANTPGCKGVHEVALMTVVQHAARPNRSVTPECQGGRATGDVQGRRRRCRRRGRTRGKAQ
jgi:hypothetical protein